MLKVAQIEDSTQNLIAPSVYLDGVEKEKNSYKVYYSVVDNNNSWITDEKVLNSLSIYITDGINVEKRLLKDLVSSNLIKNNTVKDYAVFKNSGSNITISGWTADQNISSSIVTETILLNNNIVKTSFDGQTYNYINKIKDLDLLNFDISFTNTVSMSSSPIDGDLLVSYRPDKVGNFGFVFDLERFLESNSPLYNILKGNSSYKKQILAESAVQPSLSYFSKRNITKKENFYKKIDNEVNVILIDSAKAKYYVGIVDDNRDTLDRSYYDLAVRLEISDFSTKFVNSNIRQSISDTLKFLEEYKNEFVIHKIDKNIQDINIYIFENTYQPKIETIKKIINDISSICVLFSGSSIEKYTSLFTSMLHPLTTSIDLLERLTKFVQFLDSSTINLITSLITEDGVQKALKDTNFIFEKQFTKSGENPYSADFNYDYDHNFGLEALSSATLAERLAETPTAIKEIQQPEWETRKILEARKYFISPSTVTISNVNDLSLANIDFNTENYQLLIGLPQTNTELYNNLYLRLKEYNDFNFNYRKPETYVFQLLDSGINIKSLSNRNNNSTNNLIKSTLFDSNTDTSQASLKYITDTNVKNLYFYLDNTQFTDLSTISSSIQYNAAIPNPTTETPVYVFSTSSLNDPNLKAKSFIYYNTVCGVLPADNGTGDSIDIYILTEKGLNSIFNKKMRLFNSVFAVRKKITEKPVFTFPKLDTTNDLNLNILPSYLNRTTTPASVNISVEDL